MAKSKEDIKYATAQAKLSKDEALRVGYKAGTPLESGKIADSEPVHLFSAAQNISRQKGTIADSQPVHLFSSARNTSSASTGGHKEIDDDTGDQNSGHKLKTT